MNGSLTLCLEVIFWFALFVVFYTYLGYGIVLYILVKLKELFVKPVKRVLPPDILGYNPVPLLLQEFSLPAYKYGCIDYNTFFISCQAQSFAELSFD